MSIAALIRSMAIAGATPEAIAIAVEAIEAEQNKAAEKRAKAAERKARQRENKRDSRVTVARQSQDKDGTVAAKEPLSPTPPIQEKPIPPSPPKGGHSPHGFERFWAEYPHKVGKGAAIKAFAAALKRTDLETMLRGLAAYVNKLDDRPWCNPATWLNQDRWNDVPAQVVPLQRRTAQAPPPREKQHWNQGILESFGRLAGYDVPADHDTATVHPGETRTDRIDPGPNVLDLAVTSRRQS